RGYCDGAKCGNLLCRRDLRVSAAHTGRGPARYPRRSSTRAGRCARRTAAGATGVQVAVEGQVLPRLVGHLRNQRLRAVTFVTLQRFAVPDLRMPEALK